MQIGWLIVSALLAIQMSSLLWAEDAHTAPKSVESQSKADSDFEPTICETPPIVVEIARIIQKAQEDYISMDWNKDGVHQYARTLAQLKAQKLIPDEMAAAEASLKDRIPFKGYILSIKTSGLLMNSTKNIHGWWKPENSQFTQSFISDEKLTRGVGVIIEHKDKQIDPAFHCLVIGSVVEGSTAGKLLSILLDTKSLDFVPYWFSWVPEQ